MIPPTFDLSASASALLSDAGLGAAIILIGIAAWAALNALEDRLYSRRIDRRLEAARARARNPLS